MARAPPSLFQSQGVVMSTSTMNATTPTRGMTMNNKHPHSQRFIEDPAIA